MKIRHFALILLLLSVFSAFADKKMTIRNAENGESFEVSVPDGLKIYEYNSNWLDSIPYLLERARYGEPWAYEALGDCYRYGKEGAERSIFKTLVFYTLSDMDVDKKTEELVAENPNDIISLIYKLMGHLERKDNESVLGPLDTLRQQGYVEAEVIRGFLKVTDKDNLASIVDYNIKNPEVGTDKMMFTLLGCYSINWFPDSLEDKNGILVYAADKLPYLYDATAVKFFREDHEDMDSVKIAEKTVKAIHFLEKADKEAMLSREGATILYNHYVSEAEAGRMGFDAEEMERLAILARLPESETFIFTDK